MKAIRILGAVLFFVGLFIAAGYAETGLIVRLWAGLLTSSVGILELIIGSGIVTVKGAKK